MAALARKYHQKFYEQYTCQSRKRWSPNNLIQFVCVKLEVGYELEIHGYGWCKQTTSTD